MNAHLATIVAQRRCTPFPGGPLSGRTPWGCGQCLLSGRPPVEVNTLGCSGQVLQQIVLHAAGRKHSKVMSQSAALHLALVQLSFVQFA